MTSRFLTGAFAPATDEVTAFDLPVTGRVPPELNGRYLRNGPNPLGLEDPEAYHLFLGEGMVHGVRLRDGRAEWYRNRWIRSREVARRLGEEWSGDPDGEGFDFAANTHVLGHAGRTLALVEAGPPRTSCPMSSIRSARSTSAARCRGPTPRTRNTTRAPASCTPSRTTSAGSTFSTSSWTPGAPSPVR